MGTGAESVKREGEGSLSSRAGPCNSPACRSHVMSRSFDPYRCVGIFVIFHALISSPVSLRCHCLVFFSFLFLSFFTPSYVHITSVLVL